MIGTDSFLTASEPCGFVVCRKNNTAQCCRVFSLAANRNKSYGTYEIILIYLIVRVKTTWPEVVGYHIKLQLLWSQNGRSAGLKFLTRPFAIL